MRRVALIVLMVPLLIWLAWTHLSGPGPRTPEALVEGLAGSDAVNCFAELRQNEEDLATAAIVKGTKHKRARVRAQCARLLGERQDIALVPALTAMLDDPDSGVSNNAAKALIPLLDDDEVLELLRSSRLEPDSQLVMASALLRDQGMLANAAFVDWLLDPTHEPQVRAGIYNAIRLRHTDSYGQRRLEKDNLAAVRAARQRIARQAQSEAFDPECNEAVRCTALIAYARLLGTEAYPRVVPMLKGQSQNLREAALVAVVATKDPRSVEVLSRILQDSGEAEPVRIVALLGLRAQVQAGNQDPILFRLISRTAQDSSQPLQLRASAMASLRTFRLDPKALQIARQSLTDKEPLIRARAAQSVAALGDKNASLGQVNCLEPSLVQLKLALACESKPEARGIIEGAVQAIQARIASRGK